HWVRSERTASAELGYPGVPVLLPCDLASGIEPDPSAYKAAARASELRQVAPPTGIEPASPGRQPGSLARCLREQRFLRVNGARVCLGELIARVRAGDLHPRLRHVGPVFSC